jgi:hypothetical protein
MNSGLVSLIVSNNKFHTLRSALWRSGSLANKTPSSIKPNWVRKRLGGAFSPHIFEVDAQGAAVDLKLSADFVFIVFFFNQLRYLTLTRG